MRPVSLMNGDRELGKGEGGGGKERDWAAGGWRGGEACPSLS